MHRLCTVLLGTTASLALIAPGARAQVGHAPDRSPYTDLEYKQEWTFYYGRYAAGKDPAGVAPQAGPLIGTRYDLRLGGPVYFVVNAATVRSERTVLDPKKPTASRDLGTQAWPIYLLDVGFSLNLTGFKAYHHLVPVVGGGFGIASDFKGTRDVGLYQFGTPLAISLGTGFKWVPSGTNWQARFDFGTHLYQIKYPNTYYQSETGSAPILSPRQAKNLWKNNPSMTFGISYLFFR